MCCCCVVSKGLGSQRSYPHQELRGGAAACALPVKVTCLQQRNNRGLKGAGVRGQGAGAAAGGAEGRGGREGACAWWSSAPASCPCGPGLSEQQLAELVVMYGRGN